MKAEVQVDRASLPETVSTDPNVTMTDMYVEGDFIVTIFEISQQDFNDYLSYADDDVWNSDRQKARVLEGAMMNSDGFADILLKGEMGFKNIFTDRENGETLFQYSISPEELSELLRKMGNGEIEPYSIVETTRMEFAKMTFPIQIDEATWLTDAYIDGSNVFFEYVIDAEIDPTDIEASDIRGLKAEMLESLRENFYFTTNKKKGIKEGVRIVYIYKDNRGVEIARINIGFDEL